MKQVGILKHSLYANKFNLLEKSYIQYKTECKHKIRTIKSNEEELNKNFY